MYYRYWVGIGASIILGLVFVAAGLGKLLLYGETFKIFYTPPTAFLTPALTNAISLSLPSIELLIGLLLIIGIAAKLIATSSSVLIAAFIANNSWLISQGLGYEPCTCFGALEIILRGTLSTIGSLYLDIIMLVLVLIILCCYPGNFLTIYPWFLGRGKIGEEKGWIGSG